MRKCNGSRREWGQSTAEPSLILWTYGGRVVWRPSRLSAKKRARGRPGANIVSKTNTVLVHARHLCICILNTCKIHYVYFLLLHFAFSHNFYLVHCVCVHTRSHCGWIIEWYDVAFFFFFLEPVDGRDYLIVIPSLDTHKFLAHVGAFIRYFEQSLKRFFFVCKTMWQLHAKIKYTNKRN